MFLRRPIFFAASPQSDIDEHVAIFSFDRVHGEFGFGVVSHGARLKIVFPPVPWADYFVAVDESLSKRPTHMQADVVHGADGAVDVSDANDFVAKLELLGFSVAGKLRFRG